MGTWFLDCDCSCVSVVTSPLMTAGMYASPCSELSWDMDQLVLSPGEQVQQVPSLRVSLHYGVVMLTAAYCREVETSAASEGYSALNPNNTLKQMSTAFILKSPTGKCRPHQRCTSALLTARFLPEPEAKADG